MQDSSPLISVVIPAFNKADFITETLQSVFAQTCSSYEIIIVNDGSTDGTLQVVQLIAQEHPERNIKVIDKKNGGVSEARNVAISHARGKYITAIDADDLMEPTYLAKACELLESNACNLVSCYVELFGSETGEWIPPEYDQYGERYNNNIPTLVTYTKDLWEKTGGYKCAFPFNEDWDFFIACEKYDLRVAQIKEKLFRYRMTTDGLAANYIRDTWNFSLSLMVTSNESSYSVDRVLEGHQHLHTMPVNWIERFIRQDELHPDEWLLKLWLGLASKTRSHIEQAKVLMAHAIRVTKGLNWQPLYQLAEMLYAEGDKKSAQSLYHQCRILRPDLELLVNSKIKEAAED